MFRLPSENDQLLGSFEAEDLFGQRKGIQQAPYIKKQTNLDSNLLWLWFFFSMWVFFTERKYDD